MWDPHQYLKFSQERTRPFVDLLSQVQQTRAEFIADLGCGPGLLTKMLAERWPMAKVVGVDKSPTMLEQARTLMVPGRLEFVDADLADWTPVGPVDLIVSNAALHWLGDHQGLLTRFAAQLARAGTLAVQMPDSFNSPAHLAVDDIRAQPRWRTLLATAGSNREHVQPLTWYVERLLDLGFAVNAWETTYVHVLSGANPVLDWLKGTTLRPLLDRLEPGQAAEFLADLGLQLLEMFPARGGVTLLPFRRLFFVANR